MLNWLTYKSCWWCGSLLPAGNVEGSQNPTNIFGMSGVRAHKHVIWVWGEVVPRESLNDSNMQIENASISTISFFVVLNVVHFFSLSLSSVAAKSKTHVLFFYNIFQVE